MSKIRIDPLVSLARFYKEDVDITTPIYEMFKPYYKSFPVEFLDNGVVRVTGVVESPTVHEQRELFRALKALGYHSIEWRHHDKIIVHKL